MFTKQAYQTIIVLILFFSYTSNAQEKDITFTPEYAQRNNKKVTIEIPEVQELICIMFAITKSGRTDSNMVNLNTPYHKKMMAHFGPYAEHPSIKTMDSLLNQSIIYYLLLSANAYGFTLENSKLIPTGVYNFPAKGVGSLSVETNPILSYQSAIENFAKDSKFEEFYQSNQAYYQQIKQDYKQFGAIEEQKKWLEKRFDHKINSYRVLTSPLIGGIHATSTFSDNSYLETLLFLPIIKYNPDWSKTYNQAMSTRIIFTEIDHNYVGPLSAKYQSKINSIFDKRDYWVNQQTKGVEHYPSPIKVFDEYVTWGLFILYAHERFKDEKDIIDRVIDHVNQKLIKRGFPRSKEFNEKLVELYLGSDSQKIESIYPELLKWSELQTKK